MNAIACLAVLAPSRTVDEIVEDAFQELRALWAEFLLRSAEFDAAYDSLPWWARPGPECINSAGEQVGPVSGWPAKQDVQPPEHTGMFRYIRVGPMQLKREFEVMANLWGQVPAVRLKHRQRYWREMRSLVSRLRAQRAEEAARGIQGHDKLIDQMHEAICQSENLIYDLPDDGNLVTIAAKLFLAWRSEPGVSGQDTIDDYYGSTIGPTYVFKAARPFVRGLLADYLDELLHPPKGATYSTLSFWSAA